MKLPHGEHAIVEIVKLQDYCLSTEHPRGRHKARVFAAVLGITARDAETLRQILLQVAQTHDVVVALSDDFGQRYVLDFQIQTDVGQATIRSTWIVRVNEEIPRLTSCYVL